MTAAPLHLALLDSLGGSEMILILVVILIFFGGEKMPEFAKGLGKAIREFKKAAGDVEHEFKRAIDELPENPAVATFKPSRRRAPCRPSRRPPRTRACPSLPPVPRSPGRATASTASRPAERRPPPNLYPMKHYALFGFVSALAGAFLILILYFLGFQADVAHMGVSNWVGGIAGFAIGITCIVLGVKARRAEVPKTEDFGFGRSFKAAFMVSFFSTLFGDVFNTVYIALINPALNDSRLQEQLTKLENSGLAGANLDQKEAFTRTMFGVGPEAIIYLIFGTIIGAILSLIVAGFLTRPATLPPKV